MVHLASVPSDETANAGLSKQVEGLNLDTNQEQDEATASVYGSRFANECMPRFEMPEKEMPKEIAYRMIRDELSLDGNPMLNLASFVTTYMVCSGRHCALWGESSRFKRRQGTSGARICLQIKELTHMVS